MTNLTKIRMLSMLDEELKQVKGMISNELLWAQGSVDEEQSEMHMENAADLEEYKELLLRMREKTIEGELEV